MIIGKMTCLLRLLIRRLHPLILTTHRMELSRIKFSQRNAVRISGLFKPEELTKLAIERHGDKLAVGWSGGRCSTTALHAALKIKPDIKVIFNDTGVEYPETIKFINEITKKWNLNLIVVKPDITFWDIVKKHGFPKIRNLENRTPKCCHYLKEKPLKIAYRKHEIEAQLDGIRAAESRMRMFSIAQLGQFHYTKKTKLWKYHPIAFLSSAELRTYESVHNLPINPAYEKYKIDRTGCWPCTGYLSWEKVMVKTHPKFYAIMKERMGQRILEHYYRTRVKPPCHTERG